MKKIIFSSFLLVTSLSASALTLKCEYEGRYDLFGDGMSIPQAQIKREMYNAGATHLAFSCVSSIGYKFEVNNLQIGPEIFYSESELAAFTIYCPFISSKKLANKILKRNKPVKLGGLHASAGGLFIAGRAGIAASLRTGPCTMSSAGWGIGGGVAIDSLSINYQKTDNQVEQESPEQVLP